MNIEQVLAVMDEAIARKFRTAIEIGRWDNGEKLSPEQQEICMEALIIWETQHLPEEERIGYIHKGSKQGESCDDDQPHHVEEDVQFVTLRSP